MLHTGRFRLTLLYLDTGNSTLPISETFNERSKHSETENMAFDIFYLTFQSKGRDHILMFIFYKGLNYRYN